jgi:Carbohydrate family 9 binding domain-like
MLVGGCRLQVAEEGSEAARIGRNERRIEGCAKKEKEMKGIPKKWSRKLTMKVLVGTAVVAAMGMWLGERGHANSGSPQTVLPGKQVMVANYTSHAPTIDGVFRPWEWANAAPVYVDGSTPGTAPGVVPNIPWIPNLKPPDSPADSSFTIYTLYDQNYLYLAVTVTDDYVITDSDVPFMDDDVEVMIDGDRQPGDYAMGTVCGSTNPNCPNPVVNNEGFKLTTSARGAQLIDPANAPVTWDSKATMTSKGFVVEYRISLDSINTIDTSWWSYYFQQGGYRRPQPGDTIGFNVAVGDDDNGGDSYLRSTPAAHSDSFTAWDGRSVGFYIGAEQDWGNLYLAPPPHGHS